MESPESGTDAKITLDLLSVIEENATVSQRSIASELGIALGLANAYLKRCAKKGWIKVQQIPANRYAYYLTPKGFAEKSRLTAQYLTMSLDFFRHARTQCAEVLTDCAERGRDRVALAGAGDLGEIATLCARDLPVTLVGFVDPGAEADTFAGLPVVASVAALPPFDVVMVTDLTNPQETYQALLAVLDPSRVVGPSLLNLRARPLLVEDGDAEGKGEGEEAAP